MKDISYLLVYLILWLGFIPSAFAQKQSDDDQLKKADNLFEEGNYAEAYPMYAHLLSLSKGNVDITFKYGATLLYSSNNKAEAIPYLKKAAAKSTTDTRVYYFLGKAYQLNYEFKKAIVAYNDFKSKADSKYLDYFDVDQVIRQCENGNNLLSNLNEVLVLDKKDVSSSEFFRYYELDNLGGKILLAPEEFQTSLDEKNGHRPIIYTAPLSNLVYFSSYGKNGNTGKDIYFASRRGDGTWSDPIKLPEPVNSKYNEDFPFFHSDGKTLFFSSDGHNSMGGYDIFRSIYNPSTGSYSEPQNLDFAINTPDDDLFYIADSLNQIAYFSSARASKQNRLDVYKVKVDLIPSNMIIIKGDFISEIEPSLKNARVTIEDEQTKRQIAVLNTDDNGNYLIDFKAGGQYNFYVEAGGNGIIHSGKVEIPRLDYMAAFKQELIMIDDNGTERLMIKNYFDTPLDEDMQELTAEILKRRALLDVTPDAELQEELNNKEEPITVDSFEDLYLTAGFTKSHNNESIAEWASESVNELKNVNQEYKDMAGVAFKESNIYDNQASEKIIQADTKIQAYQYNDDPEKKMKLLTEAVELRVSAENDLIRASAALMLANQLSSSVQKREMLIADLEGSVININQAIAEENADLFAEEISNLNGFDKELKLSDRGLADPIAFIEDVKDVEVNEKNTLLDYAENLREEKNATLAKIKRLEIQYENADKKDKKAIETQLAEAKNDVAEIEKENEAAWQIYRDQDWDANVASEGVLLALELQGQDGEAIPNQESMDRVLDHIEIQQQSLNKIIIAEETALLALGLTAEEVILAGAEIDKTDIASSDDGIGTDTEEEDTPKTMEEELITGYYDMLNDARRNENKADRLEETIVLKQQLLNVIDTEIESGESTYDEENLLTLRSYVVEEVELLTASFINELNNQQTGFNEISTYIPDYQEKLDEINNSSLSDLEKNKARADYMEVISVQLSAILHSLSLMPIDDIEPIVLRRRMEDENSLRANIAWVDSEKLRLNNELVQQSEDVLSVATEDELIVSVYPAFANKRAQLDNVALSVDERSTRLIQLNESLMAKIDGKIAELNAEKYTASAEDLETIDAKIAAYTAISEEKQQEIVEAVGLLAATNTSTSDESDPVADQNTVETPVVLSSNEKSEMIATIDPEFALSYSALMNSGESQEKILTGAIGLYTVLAVSVDQKIASLKQDEEMLSDNAETARIAEEIKNWEALAISVNDSKAILSGELAGIPVAVNETPSETDSEVLADSWNTMMLSTKTDEALDLWIKEEEVSTDPGFSNSIAEASNQSQLIEELKLLKKQKAENDLALVSANKKDAKRLEKEQIELTNEIINKEIELLNARIPLVISEINDRLSNGSDVIDRSASEAYLYKANSLLTTSASKDGKEKLDILKQSYQLSLMSLQKASYTTLLLSGEIAPLYNLTDESNFTYEEKKQVYSSNIKELTSLEAENRNTMSNLEADDINKNSDKWIDHEAVSKIYRDAIVWNQLKLDELNSMQEAIYDNIIADSQNLKAPTSGEEFRTAMSEVGLNESQIEYISDNPEMQTYYAMSWKEQVIDSKLNELQIQKENFVIEASEANKNSDIGNEKNIDQLTGQEAIIAYNESKKYNTEAIIWYEKADSINLIIEALQNHKSNLIANREAFRERMDEENRMAIANIESGEPLVEEDEVIIAENEDPEPIVEDDELKVIESTDIGFMFELGTNFYTQEDPIPIDPPLPTGVIFKVQIGAFRNPIPAEHFIGLSPMTAEMLDNGITRYSVGIFYDMESATNARQQVRDLGYSDAFIVAFLNGKRIPTNQALSMLGEEPQADTESIANNNTSGNATQNDNARDETNTNVSTNVLVDVDGGEKTELRTGYYNTPNSAPATEVERTEKLFYTVQVGVYTKPVSLAEIYGIQPLNVERTGLGYTRYTSGQFTDILDAETHKSYVINQGIYDAFITAYYQGKRISIAKAQTIMLTEPQSVDENAISPFNYEEPINELEFDSVVDLSMELSKNSTLAKDEMIRNAKPEDLRYVIYLGSYQDEIPNEVAVAILEYSDAGIKKATNRGNTIYSTRELESMYEAEEWLGRFREAGVNVARIIYVVSGEEITLEQAKYILDK